MSIPAELQAHVDAGRLFIIRPLLLADEEETPRTMLVSCEIMEQLKSAFSDTIEGARIAEFLQTLEDFAEGAVFTVSEHPFKKPTDVMLARVHPIETDIWDIRNTEPLPGIRALGRFWEQDLFVALTFTWREDLGGVDGWHEEINACGKAWCALFGLRTPFRRRGINEYLTNYETV